MNKKSSKIETDKRTRSVQEWMMQGHTTSDIVRQCTASWSITPRQVYKYIRKAYEAFKESAEKDLEARKQFHIHSRLKMFRDLRDKSSCKPAGVALEILKDIAKLEGLYVEKVDHTTGGKPIESAPHEVIFKNYSEE